MNRLLVHTVLLPLMLLFVSDIAYGQCWCGYDDEGVCDCSTADVTAENIGLLSEEDIAKLDDRQLRQYLRAASDWSRINFETLRDKGGKEVDVNDQRFRDWLNKQDPITQHEFWNDLDKFGGTKDKQWFSSMMSDESIDSWFEHYEFGDIVRFFAGLEFDEMIAAIVAFLTGDWDVLEPVYVPPAVLEEALQQSGYNVEELDYPSDTQLQLIDDHLIINGNNISLDRLTTGTHTITVNSDGTVNIESIEAEEETTIKGATGLTVESDGDFTIESAESVKIVTNETQTTIVNGKGIEYREGKLVAQRIYIS